MLRAYLIDYVLDFRLHFLLCPLKALPELVADRASL